MKIREFYNFKKYSANQEIWIKNKIKIAHWQHWYKETENNRNNKTLMGQTFNWKFVLQNVVKIFRQAWQRLRIELFKFWNIPHVSHILPAATDIGATRYSTQKIAGCCQDCLTTCGHNFDHLLVYNLLIKCSLPY